MGFKTVSIIGLGYIGLPTATLLASHGLRVFGVDISPEIVNSVNQGKVHIEEPGLREILAAVTASGKLAASTMPKRADAFIIAVPTPFKADHKPDLQYIQSAAISLAPVLRKGNLVILESTSPVGTTENLGKWLARERPDLNFPHTNGDNADVQIAYCPERVLPGNILRELVANNRVIGGLSRRASALARELYGIFVKGELAITNARTAEMCKLTENSFRDVNIAFANELSMICDQLGIDVWELIEHANRHPRVNILKPGCGVGGHCIAVDPWFIVDGAQSLARLIRAGREVNDNKARWVTDKIKQAIMKFLEHNPDKSLGAVSVGCLGLAFKPDIDDLRESPALKIIGDLAESFPGRILICEPHVESLPPGLQGAAISLTSLDETLKADIVVCLVAHREFCQVREELAKRENVLDFVRMLD